MPIQDKLRLVNPHIRRPSHKIPGGFTRTKVLTKAERVRLNPKLHLRERDGEYKICIQRKLGGMGDIIMTTPAVHAVREQYPNAEITYATDPPLYKILEGNPDINIFADFRKIDPASYDYFVDITTSGLYQEKPGKVPINRIDMFATDVGVKLRDYKPVYIVSTEEQVWANTLLERQWGLREGYKFIVLSAASVDHRRTWPPASSHELINLVNSKRKDVRWFVDDYNGVGGEWNHVNTISKRFDLRSLGALINACDLFIGPDSGPIHMAGALGKPIVGTFGSTPVAARLNHYEGAVGVTADLPCIGCWYSRCAYDLACMKKLSALKVSWAVLEKL